MNGIENITEKILEEARANAGKIDADAAAEAAALSEKYGAQAEDERASILAGAQRLAANTALRADSQADIDVRSRRLAARWTVITKAFEQALEGLRALPEEKYVSWLAAEIKAAQTADAEVILDPADRERFGAQAIERAAGQYALTLAKDAGSFAGGFILREGQIETNCTCEVLLASCREELEGEIAALLFD